MCVIIHQKKGQTVSKGILAESFRRNPHGWGIMYAAKGQVKVEKGLSWESFLDTYKSLEGRELVIHMRVRTHGDVTVANCHPHPVTGDVWMMHNGIIRDLDMHAPEMSDSWHFAQDIVKPIVDRAGYKVLAEQSLRKALAARVGPSNKLVFIDRDGAITIVNRSAGIEYKGLWFSNTYGWADPENRTATKRRPTWDGDGHDDDPAECRLSEPKAAAKPKPPKANRLDQTAKAVEAMRAAKKAGKKFAMGLPVKDSAEKGTRREVGTTWQSRVYGAGGRIQ
jgi:hypothetical protein